MKKQTAFTDGVCRHERQENVKTYGGDIIAIQCAVCTAVICPIGDCDGCPKKAWKLYHFVQKTRKRYCTKECYNDWQAAKKRAEKEALEAVK